MICNLRYNYFTRLSFTIRSRLKLAIVKLIEEQNYESEKIKKSLKKNGREESDPQESNFLDSFKEYLKKKSEGPEEILYFKAQARTRKKSNTKLNEEDNYLTTNRDPLDKENLFKKVTNDIENEKDNVTYYKLQGLIDNKINILKVILIN